MQERAGLGARTAVGALPRAQAPAIALPTLPGPTWVYVFIGVEMLCQIALLVQQLAPARVVFRAAASAISMGFLFMIPGRAQVVHPARTLAVIVMAIVTLAAANPGGSTALSVLAHWCYYLAILAPVSWVARLDIRDDTLVRLLIVLWLFSFVSAIFGCLQAYFPGRFQPNISSLIRPDRIMVIQLASGEWIPRPMGLTDVPGGAASSGLYSTLLGLGITLAKPFRNARLAGIISMIAGMICIYLCQIRAMLVMLGICTTVLFTMFALSGRLSRLAMGLFVGGAIALIGFYLAFSLGGETVTSRLATLVEGDPGSVYQKNRGRLIASALTELLPEYPLGAGLGRWGMINQYFGNQEDLVWTEVQWGGWVIDGGIFMILAYPAAIVTMLVSVVRASLRNLGGDDGIWPAMVVAYGVGTLALTFSYPIFMSNGGIDFWLLTAVTLQMARYSPAALNARPS